MAARFLQIAALAMCIYWISGAELGTSTVATTSLLSTPEECARECNVAEPPKTCYYHFNLEYYSVLGAACQLCTPNATNFITADCQCVQADGVERGFISINRMLPGPSIQVCENDKVVVDVANHIEGNEVTIHWHGILQKETQYYDGVPFVTQCPIPEGTTFRYQWVATAGTHFYHSHTGLQKIDGVHGGLVVRQPRPVDPNGYLYDYDLTSHVIVLSDWFHEPASEHMPGRVSGALSGQNPQSLLINGKGQFTDPITGVTTTTPLEVFTVTPGKRYRFRVITAFSGACPAQLTIEGHNISVIATDGDSVYPVRVNSLNSFSGERYDFVINANQVPGTYWIQLRALGGCITANASQGVHQLAKLQYAGSADQPRSSAPTALAGLPVGVVMNPLDAKCNVRRADAVCVSQLKNAERIDPALLLAIPDYKIYIGLNSYTFDTKELFGSGTYDKFAEVGGGFAANKLINNITYHSAPSPLTSQFHEIDPGLFCNKDDLPANCGAFCKCTHKIKVSLDSIVEFVIVDEVQIPNLYHPIHLHGHSYVVIGMGHASDHNITKISVNRVRDFDRRGLLRRHLAQSELPPLKDTLPTPNNGYSIVRFRANNPGFWFVHCHFLFHIATGMNFILQVGNPTDLPPVPPGFPKCGNHVPSIYV